MAEELRAMLRELAVNSSADAYLVLLLSAIVRRLEALDALEARIAALEARDA